MKAVSTYLILFVALIGLVPRTAFAKVEGTAGPYRISMFTQPKVIPVGAAKINFEVKDSAGKPVEALEVRAIAKMPGMFMGERELRANPVPGSPGTYAMQGSFPMAGAYDVEVKITGTPGNAQGVIKVKTGQDTGGESGSGGIPWGQVLPWAVGIAAVVFIMVRVRATGQQLNWKAFLNKGTLGGLVLLAALYAAGTWAVKNLRRPGAMDPIEAQIMEMNTPAPPGTSAVTLATVKRGILAETVRYTGQAVGFVEQDVVTRVQGVIVSMPLYVGVQVKKGQVLARLDTSQLDPQLAERAAMQAMAAESTGVAAAEFEAALQEVVEARADVTVKQGGVSEAEAMLDAARQEKAAMEQEVIAMQAETSNAKAELNAANVEVRFRRDELGRMQKLFAQKAVSTSELQEAESMAADATSKARQAQGMVEVAESKVAAARANVKRAEAMIVAANRRVRQAQAELAGARAAVVSKQKAADAAKQMISRERAGIAQARAGYEAAAAQKGYATLKAEVDGVITQRVVSPGVLVNPGQAVLKVAQVKPIRLQANVAAKDLAKIRTGSKAILYLNGADQEGVLAEVSSVQPSMDPNSRTGIVEVIWPNEDLAVRPGQFVEMDIEVGEPTEGVLVPNSAIRRPPAPTDEKPYVWIASPSGSDGTFTVRRAEVTLGSSDGRKTLVTAGLSEGQQIVAAGGTYLRENAEITDSNATEAMPSEGPVVEVFVDGYKPDSVTAEAGKEITITFIRRSEEGCGTEIVFPDLKINKPLPLNEPVKVTFTPEKSGELRFTCGMDMYRGKVVVK